jgi:hypothetical protein
VQSIEEAFKPVSSVLSQNEKMLKTLYHKARGVKRKGISLQLLLLPSPGEERSKELPEAWFNHLTS